MDYFDYETEFAVDEDYSYFLDYNDDFYFSSYDQFQSRLLGTFWNCVIPSIQSSFNQIRSIILASFIFSEIFVVSYKTWHAMRGVYMILIMRLISYVLDNIQDGPIAFLGYILFPASVIFGPWQKYSEYYEFIKGPVWISVLKTFTGFLLALLFLTVSNCWLHFYISDMFAKDALAFRCSHYFVSYVAKAANDLSGIQMHSITNPELIEFPHSLVEVVIHWNRPMHFWLKTYIFKTLKTKKGPLFAIISTYIVSSLLHGLTFQIAAVLLSLAFYTYVEHNLRLKLSAIFNACIAAQPCSKKCCHQLSASNFWIRIINLGFSFLVIFHLAYLGLMFDSSSIQEEGYALEHTLKKWQSLNFYSHWIILITYLFYLII